MIRLSNLARSDVEDIRKHTVETWGRDRWLIYYRQLVAAFERISEDPDTGRDGRLFCPGMRSGNSQRHIIFFKRLDAAEGAAVILRILHQRRNMPALVYYEDPDGGQAR